MPVKYYADRDLIEQLQTMQAGFDFGTFSMWVPARPIGGGPFWQRFKLAWAVFTGRADALFWRRQ